MTAYALIGSGGRHTVIRLHVGATVVASEVGDVITRDAVAVWRSPAFTVTRVL